MKLASFAVAGALVALALPANAAEKVTAPGVTQSDEISAATRKRDRYYDQTRRVQPQRQAYRSSGFADPSFDQNGRPYRPSFYAPCTVDLGYGRFESCDTVR